MKVQRGKVRYNHFPLSVFLFALLMDPTLEIKAKLPIEELVGQYCDIKKKGRGFVCVCPFHQDKHPSMQISPDKGIAYCFACSSGGDIFSFYQKIEGVDFPQALKDLGQRTGVKVEGLKPQTPAQKDHKERIRECLSAAQKYYQEKLSTHELAKAYVQKRQIPDGQTKEFGVGVAPDSFSDTYQYLLKAGFSRKEIVDASLGIQKDLAEEKIYDRFRNRLMFPIYDGNGAIVGFGGRTLADDDAKYINSGETPLYNKSVVLYGLHLAKEAIREAKTVVLVEGYFDVLACHRIGIKNVVAVSGTALTEQHVKLLKRYADKVILCLDQDRAGRDAAERSFLLCAEQELAVHSVTLDQKDPDEAANADPEGLKQKLTTQSVPYLDQVIADLSHDDVQSADGTRHVLRVMVPLIDALPSAVEQNHFIAKVAALLSTTETSLKEDIESHRKSHRVTSVSSDATEQRQSTDFSSTEIALGIFLLFPTLASHIQELIEPEEPFARALYNAIKESPESPRIPEEHQQQASILAVYCEHHGFTDWSESIALSEIRKNTTKSNRDLLRKKQQHIASRLKNARDEGNSAEEAKLSQQYAEVLKLAKMSAH